MPDHLTTGDRILKYWPIITVIAVFLIATGGQQVQLGFMANAETLQNEAIKTNEQDIDRLDKLIIERRGDVRLELQDLRSEQRIILNQQSQIIRDNQELEEKLDRNTRSILKALEAIQTQQSN